MPPVCTNIKFHHTRAQYLGALCDTKILISTKKTCASPEYQKIRTRVDMIKTNDSI